MSRKTLLVDGFDVAWAFPGVFVILWSTGFVAAKLGLPYAEPATFLVLRFVLVIAILLPICWLSRAPWPSPKPVLQMAIAGILLQAGYLGGVFAAIHHGMAAVVAGWLLNERIGARRWIGLVLGLAGVMLVVGERLSGAGMGAWAIAFATLALASITFGTLWQKRHGAGVDLRAGAAIQFIAAVLVMAPFSLAFESGSITWSAEFIFALA